MRGRRWVMNDEIEGLLKSRGVRLSSVTRRGTAFFIDELLLSSIFLFSIWDTISATGTMQEMIEVTNAFVFEYISIKIMYQTIFTRLYGASLGKMAMRIRVMPMRDDPLPSWVESFNRAVFRIISEMIVYLGFIWAMFEPNNRAWHDHSARTLVVDA